MNNSLRGEVTRNFTGYFLVLVGIAVLGIGAHYKLDKLVETGGVLVSAAMLAFQSKHGSEGAAPAPPAARAPSLADFESK